MSNLGTMVVIAVNGEITESTLDAGKPEQLLATIRDALGDYLEVVPRYTRHDGQACVAFCGECGKLNQLAVNEVATRLWRLQVPMREFTDYLAGPVVVVYGPPAFMAAL